MRRVVILIILVFIIFGLVLDSFVLADEDDNSGGSGGDNRDSSNSNGNFNSGEDGDSDSNGDDSDNDVEESDDSRKDNRDSDEKSGSETKTESTFIITDEQGNKVEIKTETETNEEGKTEIKEVRKYIDENGNSIEIITKTETKGNEQELKTEKKITRPDGSEVVIKSKIEITPEEEKTSYSIKIKGTEVKTDLLVESKNEEGETKLIAKLSTGNEQEIIIMPDEALLIALEELRTTNNLTFEIKEISDDETKAVFSAKAEQEGRLFGLFNVQVDLETLINIETGEIIQTNRPWWAFLVVGEDQAMVCHVSNSTIETLSVFITEIKSYLEQGDSVGGCPIVCGDGFLTIDKEVCELGSQTCTTFEGYAGTEVCKATCDGFGKCTTTESCGDGIINGAEECDDTNIVDGDGCSSICLVEIVIANE